MTKRYFISLFISGLLTLQSCYATNLFQPLISQTQNISEESGKAEETLQLADKIATLLNDLISLINNITARIDSLSIVKEIKKSNTEQLLSIQEKLLRIKKNLSSFAHDKQKLTQLLEHLAQVSHGLEKGLQESFSTPLVFTQETPQPRSYKKMLKDTASLSLRKISELFSTTQNTISKLTRIISKPLAKVEPVGPQVDDPVEKLLVETQKHLVTSEQLIQNLGKTWVNKTYGAFTGWLNTPLFHIAPLGNTPVTPEAIGKRVVIYGCNTVLIIYNLNQNFVNEIPIPWLRNSLTKIKVALGRNVTQLEQSSPGTQLPMTQDNRFVLLNNDSAVKGLDQGMLLVSNPDGSLKVTNGLAILDDKKEVVGYQCTLTSGAIKDLTIPFDTTKQTIQSSGSLFAFTNDGKTEYITAFTDPFTNEPIYEHQTDVKFQGRRLSEKDLPESIFNHETKKFLNPSTGKELVPTKRLIFSTTLIDPNGNPVSSTLVYRDETGMSGTLSQQKSTTATSGHGIISKIFSNISWLVEPDLKTAFTLPIAGLLTSYIYEDMAELKHNIPNIKNWMHAKLSGTEAKLEAHFIPPTKSFADVVGRNAIKERLMPYIRFVENPKLALQAGIHVPRGIIFAGEPQTGKTLMAEAFLGELSQAAQKHGRTFRMIEAKVNVLVQTGFKAYIDYMKQYAPCVVFCDEFELTGAQRDQNRNLLAEFLTAISGIDSSDDIDKMVFFLVATNHPEKIDHALQEPGRLGTHIYFEMPTAQERAEYFKHSFNRRHIGLQDLNIDGLVRETTACSFGKLSDIVTGIIYQAQNKKETVNQNHIDSALDEMVRRIVIDEYDIPTEQRIALAARYGAQAFASLVLNPNKKFVGATVYKITPTFKDPIVGKNYAFLERNYNVENKKVVQATDSQPSMIYGGFFSYNTQDTFGLISHDEKLKLCKVALAGTVGQQVLGLSQMDFDSDMLVAYQYAHEIVFNGAKEEWLSEKQRDAKRDEVWQLIQQSKTEMKALLEANKEDYHKIVELLQRRYIIRTSNIKECFNLTSVDLTSYFTRLNSKK